MRSKPKTRRRRNAWIDQVAARKAKAVAFFRRLGKTAAADKLEAESVEDYAARKGIKLENPQSRKNAGQRYGTAQAAIDAARRGLKRKEKAGQTKHAYHIARVGGAWQFVNMRAVENKTHYVVYPDGTVELQQGWLSSQSHLPPDTPEARRAASIVNPAKRGRVRGLVQEFRSSLRRGACQEAQRLCAQNPVRRKQLSIPDKHLLKIARDTLNMPDAMVGVMGGLDKEGARKVIRDLTGRAPKREKKKNAGVGNILTFHGAFNEKADAVQKESQTPGAFIKTFWYQTGPRYAVVTKNPRRALPRPDQSLNSGFFIVNTSGSFVAGPFKTKQAAQRIRKVLRRKDHYSMPGSPTIGETEIIEKGRQNGRRRRNEGAQDVSRYTWGQRMPQTGTIVDQIRAGDRVTILTPQNQKRTGRAVMPTGDRQGWVLNLGGKHGTPGIAVASNIVSVKKRNAKESLSPKEVQKMVDLLRKIGTDPEEPSFTEKMLARVEQTGKKKNAKPRRTVMVLGEDYGSWPKARAYALRIAKRTGNKVPVVITEADGTSATHYVDPSWSADLRDHVSHQRNFDVFHQKGKRLDHYWFYELTGAAASRYATTIQGGPFPTKDEAKIEGKAAAAIATNRDRDLLENPRGVSDEYSVWKADGHKWQWIVKIGPEPRPMGTSYVSRKDATDRAKAAVAKIKTGSQNPGRRASKTFDTSTVAGVKAAERFKSTLENKYNSVRTVPVGLNRVMITGTNPIQREIIPRQSSADKSWTPHLDKDIPLSEIQLPGESRSKKNSRRRRNSESADQLYEDFHGEAATNDLFVEDLADHPELAKLGDMVSLHVKPRNGQKFSIDWDRNKPVLASEPGGGQLFLIGGDQNLDESIDSLGVDTTKDMIDIGEALRIEYHTRKGFDNFQPTTYYHEFGEETGERPRLMYEKIPKRIFIVGGAYQVKPEGIVN